MRGGNGVVLLILAADWGPRVWLVHLCALLPSASTHTHTHMQTPLISPTTIHTNTAMSSKHDKKKGKHQSSGSGGGVGALLDVFSSSSNATMAAKTAEWESKGDAGVVGDDVRCAGRGEVECEGGGLCGWEGCLGWMGACFLCMQIQSLSSSACLSSSCSRSFSNTGSIVVVTSNIF
jgi:hypothetical protein